MKYSRFQKLLSLPATLSFVFGTSIFFCQNVNAAKNGEPAPLFSGLNSLGKNTSLEDFKGKWVVLEWHNKDCPFVKRQYDSGHLQKIQERWTKDGVIWLSIISSAKGKEGYVDAKGANKDVKSHHAHVTATLLDPLGTIGHAYDAKTTPHLFVINPKGILIYQGALDNRPNADPATAKTDVTEGEGPYIDYVSLALDEAKNQGKAEISTPTSDQYGCSIKYKN